MWHNPPPVPSRKRWLVNRITAGDQVWVSLRHSKLSRPQLDMIVAEHDKLVVWQCTDHTDQLLLIAEPGNQLRSPLPALSGGQPLRPMVLQIAFPLLVLAIAGMATLLNGYLENDPGFGLSIAAMAVGTPLALYSSRLFPRSARVGFLVREFNGSHRISVLPRLYGLSDPLIAQLAASYGYYYTGQSILSPTSAIGRFVTFVKRPW